LRINILMIPALRGFGEKVPIPLDDHCSEPKNREGLMADLAQLCSSLRIGVHFNSLDPEETACLTECEHLRSDAVDSAPSQRAAARRRPSALNATSRTMWETPVSSATFLPDSTSTICIVFRTGAACDWSSAPAIRAGLRVTLG